MLKRKKTEINEDYVTIYGREDHEKIAPGSSQPNIPPLPPPQPNPFPTWLFG